MMRGLLHAALVLSAIARCGGARTELPAISDADRRVLASLSPDPLPPPPPDASNRFADDRRAARFGQRLFFDSGFSGKLLDGDNDGSIHTLGVKGQTGKVACAGCHLPTSGFQDTRTLNAQISLAAGWGKRRAPSLLDIGQARLVMWDGRRDALYNQPFGPIESPVEMNSSRLFVAQQIARSYKNEYEAIFGPLPPLSDPARFPQLSAELTGCQPVRVDPREVCDGTIHGMPGDGAEYDRLSAADQQAVTRVVVNAGKAIGAYVRLLSCGPGRFDRWVHGEQTALSAQEQRGAALFIGRGKCVPCHSGPYLTDQQFHNVGLKPALVAVVFLDADDHGARNGLSAALLDPLNVKGRYSDGDDGRLPSAVPADADGAFRTPGLRCVSGRPSFFHTGQVKTLEGAVTFFNEGGHPYGYPGKSEIAALGLAASEVADLVAFLKTLDGPGPDASLLVAPP